MICRKWHKSLTILRVLLSLLLLGQGIPAFASPGTTSSPIAVRVCANYGKPSVVTRLDAQTDFTCTVSTPPQSGRVMLSWSAPHSGDGSSVFSYVVKYATFPVTPDLMGDTTSWWNNPNAITVLDAQKNPDWGLFENQTPASLEMAPITGLKPGLQYYFGVRALDRYHQMADADGNLASVVNQSSAVASSIPLMAQPINTLQCFVPDSLETQTVRLEWNVPRFWRYDYENNRYMIDKAETIDKGAQYCVQYSTENPNGGQAVSNTWAMHSLYLSTGSITTGDHQQLLIHGLTEDATYYFMVFTKTDWGWAYSNVPAASCRPYQHIGTVDNLTATYDGSDDPNVGSSIVLSWKNPTVQFMSGVNVCYSTSTYPVSSNQQPFVTLSGQLSGETTGYTFNQLLPRTTYYFAAYAYDTSGTYAPAVLVSTCTIKDILGPDPVSQVTSLISMDDLGKLSVSLSWTTPAGTPSFRNGDYAGTEIGAGSVWTQISGGNNQTQQYIHHDVQINTSYYYVLRGYDVVNNRSLAVDTTVYISDVYEKPGNPVIISKASTADEDIAAGCSALLQWKTPETSNLKDIKMVYRTDRFPISVNDGTPVIDNRALTAGTTYDTTLMQLEPATTYYFGLAVVSNFNIMSDLTLTDIFTTTPWNDSISPFLPLGIRAERLSGTSVRVSWKPVHYNNDRKLFDNKYSPRTRELYSYDVYRSTDLYAASWERCARIKDLACSYTDTISANQQYFYKTRAYDASGNFRDSFIADMNDGVIVMNSDNSYVWLPRESITDSNYMEIVSNAAEEQGPIVRSIEWHAYDVIASSPSFDLSTVANFSAQRNVAAAPAPQAAVRSGELVMSSKARQAAPSAAGEATGQVQVPLSIFYFNGSQWLKLNSTADTAAQCVKTPIKFTGKYQLRAVSPATEFTFLGIMPRIITPNNDGMNDRVLFRYSNPKNSAVNIRVFDIRGALVKNLEQSIRTSDIQGEYIYWDGADTDGSIVAPGVYIYQIEGEGKLLNGTIVVAR